MNTCLNTSNNSLLCSVGSTRYTQLALLSLVDTFFTVLLSTFVIVQRKLSSEVKSHTSWTVLRLNFDNITTFSEVAWREATNRSRIMDTGIWFSWLIYVFCAVTVFTFFGWDEELRRRYLSIWAKFLTVAGISKEPTKEEHEVDTVVFADGTGSIKRTVQRDSIIERTFENEGLETGDYPSLCDVIVTSRRTTFPDIEQANDILRDSPRLMGNERGTCR